MPPSSATAPGTFVSCEIEPCEQVGRVRGWFSLGRFAPRCARESMNVNGGTDGEIRSDLLLVDLRYHFRRFEQSSSFFFPFLFFFYGSSWLEDWMVDGEKLWISIKLRVSYICKIGLIIN